MRATSLAISETMFQPPPPMPIMRMRVRGVSSPVSGFAREDGACFGFAVFCTLRFLESFFAFPITLVYGVRARLSIQRKRVSYTHMQELWRSKFFFIYLAVFVNTVAFSLVFPLLPLYAKTFH